MHGRLIILQAVPDGPPMRTTAEADACSCITAASMVQIVAHSIQT